MTYTNRKPKKQEKLGMFVYPPITDWQPFSLNIAKSYLFKLFKVKKKHQQKNIWKGMKHDQVLIYFGIVLFSDFSILAGQIKKRKKFKCCQ